MANHREKSLQTYEGDNGDFDEGAAALGRRPEPVKNVMTLAFNRVPVSRIKIRAEV